jgi:tRNA(adenine34) deaminase
MSPGFGDLVRLDPMAIALDEARRAGQSGEVPVGACLVRAGQVLASAGNAMRQTHDPTAHAEIRVIRHASAELGTERLVGCDLYVSLEPCAMCAAAIGFARLRRVYYAAADPKGGAIENGPRYFNQPTCHHIPEIYGGIRAGEAADLLRAFFASRRGGRR